MEHFLYVFSERERDALLAMNYTLIKSNETKHTYVFENRAELHFDLNEINAIPSDTLTF